MPGSHPSVRRSHRSVTFVQHRLISPPPPPSPRLYAVSTYPLDLVRSRISIATASISMRKPADEAARISGVDTVSSVTTRTRALDRDLGIWGMTKKVYRTEGGLRGL